MVYILRFPPPYLKAGSPGNFRYWRNENTKSDDSTTQLEKELSKHPSCNYTQIIPICVCRFYTSFLLPHAIHSKILLIEYNGGRVVRKTRSWARFNFQIYVPPFILYLRHIFKYPANKVRKMLGKLPPKEGGAFGPVF